MRLSDTDWIVYLTRPFSLFGASLWNDWYVSDYLKKNFDAVITKSLFIEKSEGVVTCYREKVEQVEFFEKMTSFAIEDPDVCMNFLREAAKMNERALGYIKAGKQSFNDLDSALNFFTEHSILATMLPVMVLKASEAKNVRPDIVEAAENLRTISLYKDFELKVIVPLVLSLDDFVGLNTYDLSLLTVNEIKNGDTSQLNMRRKQRSNGFKCVFEQIDGRDQVVFTEDVDLIARRIEGDSVNGNTESIKGQPVYKGSIRGKVKIIYTMADADKFEDNDILVTINSNPSLMPLLKRCAAIVTDEGGVTCHAAIVSREVKKPCIVGTRNATQVLEDNDEVEVDANRGVVERL